RSEGSQTQQTTRGRGGHPPIDLGVFSQQLNQSMVRQNIYYQDLIDGSILRPLVIRPLKRDAFRAYMKTQGKLGGQNKVPRLSNDRKIADFLIDYAQ
ncbi:MAG: GH3 auxin-responsive promoter family protein, partial [Bacteroidota bacterium]